MKGRKEGRKERKGKERRKEGRTVNNKFIDDLGGQSLASHRGGPGSIPSQST